eukprot:TRINITY_DN11439_c0_g1_i2.p1 TRINITY_DN11439_c0_g1~~TRINITY_DN11439_c0_g1_i2.p1  ORF type:complete len:1101 (-),score=204.28 TRINITY_DN11439_c0_g1_i2:72-3092(-)
MPSQVTTLTKLTSLTIGVGNFTTIPTFPADSPINSLGIMQAALASFPLSLLSMRSLSALNLNGNKISVLPDFPSLVSAPLQSLNLQDNGLRAIPSTITNLKLLTQIYFQRNKISAIPFLPTSSPITSILIGQNSISSIDSSLLSLKNLTEIDLANNKLTTFPDFPPDSAMKRLALYSNMITSLPYSLSQLTQLTLLRLEKNYCLGFNSSYLPSSLQFATTKLFFCSETCSKDPKITSRCTNSVSCVSGSCFCSNFSTESSCKSAPSSDGLSCEWCTTSSKCEAKGSCTICEEVTNEDDCTFLTHDYCGWCKDEGVCRSVNTTCKQCSSLSFSDCSNLPNCKFCEEFQQCISTESKCARCNSFSNSDCATNKKHCRWCSSVSMCLGNSSTCSSCQIYDQSSCSSGVNCDFCSASESCEYMNDCKICGAFTIGASCRANEGCNWCYSQSECADISVTNCPNCTTTSGSECKNLPGCSWCASTGVCIYNTATCPSCRSLGSGQCGATGYCHWCPVNQICSEPTKTCVTCSTFGSQETLCKLFQSSCHWDGYSCVANPEETAKSKTSAVVIVVSIILVLVVATSIVIVTFMLKKRKATEQLSQQISSIEMRESQKGTPTACFDSSALSSPHVEWSVLSLKPSREVIIFGGLSKINKVYTEYLTVSNFGDSSATITIYPPPETEEHVIACNPPQFHLNPNEQANVTVELLMRCTKKLKAAIFFDCLGFGNAKIMIQAESEPSIILSYDEIIKRRKLGEGGFGIVYQGFYRGTEVAIKEMKSAGLSDPTVIEEIYREVDLMRRLRSPFIVSFFGAVTTKERMCIVMEYCKYGNLGALIKSEAIAPEFKLKCIADAARGMLFLHENNIIHRDLKPDNLLIVATSPRSCVCIKITDFGASRLITEERGKNYTKGVGTPIYMSPELMEGLPYSFSSDVFSFAITMWEIWTQQPPYLNMHSGAVLAFVSSGRRLPLPESCPVCGLIALCWSAMPKDRPRFSEIVKSIDTGAYGMVV